MNTSNCAVRYQGGKGGDGVYQKIIDLMPLHKIYIETHFGGGNIFYRKKAADRNIVIDIDPAVTSKIAVVPGVTVINGDSGHFLKQFNFSDTVPDDVLIYCDPPYMLETRTKKKIYNFEYTDAQHVDLLTTILAIGYAGVNVMISGYRSPLYDAMLDRWNRKDFNAMTRGGVRVESVWFNFDDAGSKHEYTYLGVNFRERERIKRQQKRIVNKINRLPVFERLAMLQAIESGVAHD